MHAPVNGCRTSLMIRLSVLSVLCLACACGLAWPAVADATTCSAGDAPSHKELSKLRLTPPSSLELNLDQQPRLLTNCSPSSNGSDLQGLQSTNSQPLLTTTSSAQDSPSSHDLLTTLSLVVLVNNLMPRPLPPTWAMATTAAAWLWLAFHRLQPWLPQTSPPSRAATATTAASGADAVAAAAGLSSAATAAGAAAGIGGEPSTRWWQHALLFLELLWGNAVDAMLLMGLLLLPVIALTRWWAGRRMWGSTTPAAATASTAAGAAAASAASPTEAAGDNAFQNLATAQAMRRSFDGVSAQLQSAGNTAARMAKAMQQMASKARHRHSISSSDSNGSNSGIATPNTHSHASSGSNGRTSTSSSTGSMVSPEQSCLQPNTPPLLFVSRPDGPLAGPGRDQQVLLAQPLVVSPTQDEILAGRDAAARAAAAATGTPWPETSSNSSSSRGSRSSTPAVASPDSNSSSSSSCPPPLDRSSQPGMRTAQQSIIRARPGDSTGAQQDTAAAPSGSHSDSSSSAAAAASLNLGAVGTIRTVSAHGATPPVYPTRALYTSPLETVVISCKLGSTSSSSPLQTRGIAMYAAPSTSPLTGVGSAAAAAAGGMISSSVGVQVPLNRAQANLAAAGGHGSSISAQRELRSVVEAAVRQAIADSNVAVLSTSVTSFPGCVHVVATAHLTAADLAATAAVGAESAAAPAAAESRAAAARVVWQQLVQQIVDAQQSAASTTGSDSYGVGSSATGALAAEGLFLKHLLVQDGAGNIHYVWVSPQAAAEVDTGLAADTSVASVQSGSGSSEPVSPTASTSSSKSSQSPANGLCSRLIAAASGMSISSLTLPVDAPDSIEATATLADAESKLLLPAEVAAALADGNAGLRIVLSATPQAPAAPAASPAEGPYLSSSPVSSSKDSPLANPFALAATAGRTTSSTRREGDMPNHVLVDHTLWPGTSSWPAGNEFDLKQLLPNRMRAAALLQQFGPVLTLNLVASTRKTVPSAAAVAEGVGAGPRADQPSEMQPNATSGADSAASIVLSTLAAGVPDAAPVQDQQPERSGSAAQQLHSDISILVQRLRGHGSAEAAAGAATTVSNAETAAAVTAEKAPVAAPGDTVSKKVGIGEHLLLQVPLLLLPSAACRELVLLQQRMAKELGGDGPAAARQHMLPLIHDIAAALSMCRTPAAGAVAAAPAVQLPAAAPSSPGCTVQHTPLDSTSATAALADTADAPRLTGVRALIAQQERMAAAAAAAGVATVASPRASAATSSPRAALSPRTSRSSLVLSPSTSASSLVLSPSARLSPVRSPTWRRSRPSSPAALSSSSYYDRAQVSHSPTPTAALPPAQTQPAEVSQQLAGPQLSTEQKQLVKQILQFVSDQGLDTLAAALCSYVHVDDVRELSNRHDAGGSPAAAALPSTGINEIEPVQDEQDLKKPAAAATPPMGTTAAPPTDSPAVPASNSAAQSIRSSAGSPMANTAPADDARKPLDPTLPNKEASKALKQASAAHEQAVAAQRAAAATESALQLALQQISALSVATAEANRQAAEAQATAAAASQRAAAVEQRAERERALQLISNPAGAPAAGSRGVGICGLLSGITWAAATARATGTSLLGGTLNAAEAPVVPVVVTPRDVLLGFSDERLEVQYRRLKALQCRAIDRAAFLMQLFRQVVYVWRIARLMFVSAGTGLSLVLLCKYEAVVLLPYVMMVLTPDFYIYHRHLLLCLSHIAAALTVGMIAATEVYRNEWSALLNHPGPSLLARPSMMLAWYYLLLPVLQQQTLPEQAISCVAQLVHSLLIYVFIIKGSVSLALVLPLLVLASGLSFAVSYVADVATRQQAVAAARRSVTRGTQ